MEQGLDLLRLNVKVHTKAIWWVYVFESSEEEFRLGYKSNRAGQKNSLF
jgi:hypothetical protein